MTLFTARHSGASLNPGIHDWRWIPACAGMTVALLLAVDAWAADTLGPERQRELTRLVRQECGFCHGLRLTGGLGSPLTAAAMRERPAETMIAVILHGIPGTAMPGWQPFLTEADAGWIVTKLQEGFPE